MVKRKFVIFQDGYARILINPDHNTIQNILQSGLPYLVDPDTSLVRGTAPEYWKLINRTLVPMTKEEQELRNKDPELELPHNPIFIEKEVRVPYIQFKTPKWAYYAAGVAFIELILLSILLGVQ